MTDELLPALPEPKWLAVDTPGADFDVTFVRSVQEADEMDEGEPPSHREPLFNDDQLRAYAREAIRLAHGEVAMWAYRRAGSDEAWRPFFSSEHRANTEASPEWEVAALYRTSPPAGEVA